MRYLVLAGRILFSLIFITAAPRHFSTEGILHAAQLAFPLARLAGADFRGHGADRRAERRLRV